MKRVLILSILLILSVSIVYAAVEKTITGKVVRILDGDTIEIVTAEKATIRIRLAGIDCPEKKQPFGQKAKEVTANSCGGKMVTIRIQSKDRYGRFVGEVIMPDGKNLNQELVKAGLAWWYRKYSPNDKILERLEAEARAAKRGLWSEPNPIAPWDYRKNRKKK